MDNIYLIYGDEEFLIDKEIKNIINKFNSSMENVVRYNLDESNVKEAIEDACTISMFETNKIVICEKCNFLTGENKKEVNHDIDSLIKYINNPFSDSVLIFVVRNPKLDERKKVVKELKKCSKVIECKTIENYNLNNYISNYFKTNNYEISQSDVKLIIDKVKDVVIDNIEDNIFSLTNAIMDKDIKRVINIYNDLLLMGEEPIKLIVMIANQFRLILQVKLMVKNGYKERDMASEIGEHPYRVKLASNARFTIKELITYIKKLQKLDYDIKSGNIDKNFGLEFFLLNI